MSYSGFTERLCLNGHYSAYDVWAETTDLCADCGAEIRYTHGVDQTNGYDESESYSCRAPKAEIAREDVWHEDHLGNAYATIRFRYAPEGEDVWVKVNSMGRATPPYPDDLAPIEAEGGDVKQAPSRQGRKRETAPDLSLKQP